MLKGSCIECDNFRTATKVVAVSDASPGVKSQVDYVCDRIEDEKEIQAAIDAILILEER